MWFTRYKTENERDEPTKIERVNNAATYIKFLTTILNET